MDNPKVKVRHTKKTGRGVFALRPIRKGEIIAIFDGPIYDADHEPWTKEQLTYTIQFAKDKWRDSKGLARYLNHSCDPNCGIKGLSKVVAMRAIAAGDEVTWDYEMTEKSWWMKMKCRCGSPICRGTIGSYARMPRAIRKKYKGYISSWLTSIPTERKRSIDSGRR